jgi:hypothetical protein
VAGLLGLTIVLPVVRLELCVWRRILRGVTDDETTPSASGPKIDVPGETVIFVALIAAVTALLAALWWLPL